MAAAEMTRQTKGNGDRRVIADQLIHGDPLREAG